MICHHWLILTPFQPFRTTFDRTYENWCWDMLADAKKNLTQCDRFYTNFPGIGNFKSIWTLWNQHCKSRIVQKYRFSFDYSHNTLLFTVIGSYNIARWNWFSRVFSYTIQIWASKFWGFWKKGWNILEN